MNSTFSKSQLHKACRSQKKEKANKETHLSSASKSLIYIGLKQLIKYTFHIKKKKV